MSENEQKKWKVRTADKTKELSFLPMFETKQLSAGQGYNSTDKDVECLFVDLQLTDDKGQNIEMRLNFLDLYMFVYFVANEELRQSLQLRYERQASQIPYEVTFSLSPEEKQSGVAKRLITLTVDEIAMAIARAQAREISGKKSPHRSIEEYMFAKRAKKIIT